MSAQRMAMMLTRAAICAVAATAGAMLIGPASAASMPADPSARAASHKQLAKQLRSARAATARYRSIRQARRAGYGYPPDVPLAALCVKSPAGGMGVHAENAQLMDDPDLNVRRPEILLYEPVGRNRLRLVGVEYWKADADGDLATDDDRPSLFGQPFDGPFEGHYPGMPVHYDLHVWLFEKNLRGTFAPFNPAVHCP